MPQADTVTFDLAPDLTASAQDTVKAGATLAHPRPGPGLAVLSPPNSEEGWQLQVVDDMDAADRLITLVYAEGAEGCELTVLAGPSYVVRWR